MNVAEAASAGAALLKQTYLAWGQDKAPRLGAAISYYTVFSLAPLLLISIAVASFVVGGDTARDAIIRGMGGLVGQDGAKAIEAMIDNAARNKASGILSTVLGLAMLLLGSTGVFVELQDALNTIWGVEEKPGQGIRAFLRNRMLSFAMVLAIGFLLLVSLVVSGVLSALGDWMSQSLPGSKWLWQILNLLVSLVITAGLFALIFKVLPDVELTWRDVAIGAGATAVLFTLGKFLIGLYLGKSTTMNVFGAAGSLAVVFIWVYYSAQIVLFGAEFTQVWANTYGTRMETGKVPAQPGLENAPARARRT